MESNNASTPLEHHPWPPFIPNGAKLLILGTFPPGEHRWSMDFYYPNRTNDFWKICGLLFFENPYALYNDLDHRYNKNLIIKFLTDKKIALHDTARIVRRLKGNASDKFLEIIEPIQLYELLKQMPNCHTIATTGEKAANVIANLTNTKLPKMGEMIIANDDLNIWRMPSTSRAYPLALEKKAAYYAKMFQQANIF